jgi:Dyp-type peroxidase family
MTRELNLADIQGNIVRAYGAYGFARARYFFLHIDNARVGRAFVDAVRRKVTTAERWSRGGSDHENTANYIERPKVTLNISFTFKGLTALELPTRTLQELPDEYIEGMAMRHHILGDTNQSAPGEWDQVWLNSNQPGSKDEVHIWISMNALVDSHGKVAEALDEQTDWLRELCEAGGGVRLLFGNGPEGLDYQDAGANLIKRDDGIVQPSNREHFGYADGFGNPVFHGQFAPDKEKVAVVGRGKIMPDQSWQPLAAGEFILGHPDESQGLPTTSKPWEFTNNGTFMVYRKLHENTKSFADFIDQMAEQYAVMMDVAKDEARETVMAKMVGRWPNGVPLSVAPTYADKLAFDEKYKGREIDREIDKKYRVALRDFKFADDLEGFKCPVSAHMRRANTRDMLDPKVTSKDPRDWSGSALNKRRRILRRGLPYGKFDEGSSDSAEHGIVFIAICASLFRQFEFVQQQWMQYGLDFNVGNETCPIIGNHGPDQQAGYHGQESNFVIAADPKSGKPPFVCPNPPQFVTTRGGDYFFLPSMTALEMIAMGSIDPT